MNKLYISPPFDIDKEHLGIFNRFLSDSDEHEMYISGAGGSGKTTLLIHFILELVDKNIPFLLGAYTHAACRILRQKIFEDPESAEAVSSIRTVHSFLKKSPGVNVNSLDIRRVNVTNKRGKPEPPKVLLFDEYSMIGEEDYMDIGELCMDEETGEILVKTIYIGDAMQLPPVKSARTIYPRGAYQINLLVNHRADSTCLVAVLDKLREMKETGNISRLPECDVVHRKVDIVKEYTSKDIDFHNNKILCYTNFAVDMFNGFVYNAINNTMCEGLVEGDDIFVDTHKLYCTFESADSFELRGDKDIAVKTNNKQVLTLKNDTYNTISFLLDNFDFMYIDFPGEGRYVKPYVFGNMNYMNMDKLFKQNAIASNQKIVDTFNIDKSRLKEVKTANYNHPDVEASRKAWRLYLTFQNNVTMVSRPYASTVHKAQGVTLKDVYISNKDLLKLYERDKMEYLSLFYTAMSRTRNEVYIDN